MANNKKKKPDYYLMPDGTVSTNPPSSSNKFTSTKSLLYNDETDYTLAPNGKVLENTSKTFSAPTRNDLSILTPTMKMNSLFDIAPVKNAFSSAIVLDDEEEEEKEKERTWFTKGAFEDGYQFGDVYKTAFGSIKDFEYKAVEGILEMPEMAIDTLAGGVGWIGGILGNDDFKNNMAEFAEKDLYDAEKWAKYATPQMMSNFGGGAFAAPQGVIDFFGGNPEENSVLGEKSHDLVKSAGQLGATIALQMAGVPWFLTTGMTSAGGEFENALRQGATYEEAMGSALITAGADILTEKLFGGSGLKETGILKDFTESLAKDISSDALKVLVKYGIDVAGEGGEEVLASVFSNLGTALYKAENPEDIKEILWSKEAREGYFESLIGGMVISGGVNAGKVYNSIQTGRDYDTGLTQNEQKVYDKVLEETIKEKTENGKKELSKKERAEIEQEVQTNLQRGYIDIETIESALGGESYTAYDNLVKESEEFNTLFKTPSGELSREQQLRLEELETKNNSTPYETEIARLKEELSLNVDKLTQADETAKKTEDTFLRESYNERTRRGQRFEADLTKYDEKQQKIVKKAMDSGILNNTNRSHELVDLVAKLSADKNTDFDFTNNERLKESGFALEGVTVDGFVKDGSVTLNVQSPKVLNSLVGHEITHVLEGTELYTDLQNSIKNYAVTKGEYQTRFDTLFERYKTAYKDMDADQYRAQIEKEVTSDLVGDYLFTDADFVSKLSVEQPNIFKKVYEEIKYLVKVATAGSMEAVQLEQVKRAFEKVYKETAKTGVKAEDGRNILYDVNEEIKNGIDVDQNATSQQQETLEKADMEYDPKTETVTYSLSSLEDAFNYNKGESEYTQTREEYVQALMKSINDTTDQGRAKAERFLDSMFLVHDMIARDKDRLDYEASVGKSAWVSNTEYGGSIDFSTLCAKRRLFTGTFDAIQNALPDTVLTDADYLQIRNLLLKHNQEAPCSMCYVEGSRAKHGTYVKRFLNEYLKTNPEWKPQIADFASATRLEQTRIQHPEAYAEYVKAMNKLSQRKPKEASVRTDYKGEILDAFKNGESVEQKNVNGGIRFNSFSDFEIIHTLDAMQVITDMARVGLNGQAYTKVREFAECFGNTGMKINLSLVAKDVDSHGNLIMDEVNGMKYSDALELRGKYSDNVGTVIVVFNDAQMKSALANPNIDFVLPFHRSQWRKSQYTMMGLPTVTKDFTNVQNDRYRNPKTGRPKKAPVGNIMPNEYWDFSKSGRENAQIYLDYINENNYIPKFDSVLDKVDGKYVLPEGAVGDGYFKLLIDFKMYNNEGVGTPQKPVLPDFNMPYIEQMLEDYKGGHQSFPVAHDVVQEFLEIKRNKTEVSLSLSDANQPPAPMGNWQIRSKDVLLDETIAPMKEATQEIAPEVAPEVTQETLDEYAPITEEKANERDALLNDYPIDESYMPDEVEEPYYEDNPIEVESPFDARDIHDVGNRKQKAYMYENPEVKPYFQEEAQIMLGELRNSIKGEKHFNDQLYYDTNGEQGWFGTKRETSEQIAYMLDNFHYTYAEIEKGLKAIIEDNGKENIAVSKRLEFMIDERLREGYTDFMSGYDIPANQDYIDMLAKKQITEYSDEAYNQYLESLEQEYATQKVAPIQHAPAKVTAPAKGYEAIEPRPRQNIEPAPVYSEGEEGQWERNKMARTDAPVRKDGRKQRKWVKTSTESDVVNRGILPEDLDQKKITYEPIPNKKTLSGANARLDVLGYEKAVAYFEGQITNNRIELEDIALGERLIQEAMKRGDTVVAGNLIQDVAILGTELGQKVQALSIIKRLTPEGQLRMLQRTVERGKIKGDKAYKNVKFTRKMQGEILKTYKKDGSYDQAELNKAVESVKQQIADQMQVTAMEKINAWRYLSMLGNPKTHIRNLVSNIAMKGTLAVKNTLARTIEDIAPIKNQTKTWKRATNDVKEFAKKTTIEMKDVISDDNKYGEDTGIKAKRDIFKNKILNGVYEFNSELLSKEDWWFSKGAFNNSLAEFLTANGIRTKEDIRKNRKLIEKAKAYATEQSQIATFRQYSWLANKIRDIESKNIGTEIAVGSIIPFKKTPINIAKAGLSYSPLGFAKTLTYDMKQVASGKMEASQLIDNLSQNVTGTGLAMIGYLLASAGFLNGGGEEDKEGQYDYQLGEQKYSISFGGNTYSLSWLSPVAMPLFVGANAYEQLVEGKEWSGDVVVETLAQTLDPLSEMSFLSGLDTVLSSYDSGFEKFAGIGKSMLQNYASQFIPTLSSQVATVLDDKKRSTKVAGDSDFKFFDETLNQLMYKIPFLREILEPTTDIWGNEVKQNENLLTRAFETFIAPYSRKESIATDIDAELKNLHAISGEDGVIPHIPYNYVNYEKEKYEMSASEYTNFKKTYGQTANSLLEDLFRTSTYQNASSDERVEMVENVYKYSMDEAKKNFLNGQGVQYTNATEDGTQIYRENYIKGAIENDMTVDEYRFYSRNPEEYAVAKAVGGYEVYDQYSDELYDIRADKDENGKSISGSRKEKVIRYVNELDVDYGMKLILFKNEYNADDTYNEEIIEYLNTREDITYEEMETILKYLGFEVDSDGTVRW